MSTAELVIAPRVSVLDYGYVSMLDSMGDDLAIVNNAKVSFDARSDDFGNHEQGVLRYMMREKHGSPFESVVFRFEVCAPIFVNREWFRHRIGSFNEQSSRYKEMSPVFYLPEGDNIRSQEGKPGRYTFARIEDPEKRQYVHHIMESTSRRAWQAYKDMMEMGVAKEQARNILPLNLYSTFIWTVNLRALLNFLSLRQHETALWEIRQYANAIAEFAEMVVPSTMESFEEGGRVCP